MPRRIPSELETQFANLWVVLYPDIDLHSEHQFLKDRKFSLDFAHLDAQVAIEIQGGIYQANRGHNSISGIKRDCEKYSLAASNGWLVFLLTDDMISEFWLHLIADTIKSRSLC